MYLYGASGHAKVIIDILKANGVTIEALYDDNPNIHTLLDFPVYIAENIQGPLIISIGDNKIRASIANSMNIDFGYAIHPSAIISTKSFIDKGSVVMQGAIVQSSSKIGKHCIINTGASVDHDCIVEDFVHISPQTVLCGNVKLGEGCWIGAGSVILPGVKVGKWSVIGAGSVVSKNIPEKVLAVGNRCNVIKKI